VDGDENAPAPAAATFHPLDAAWPGHRDDDRVIQPMNVDRDIER